VTFVVLTILAVVWAIYLVSWFRSRAGHRSVNSISSFNRHLSVLERTSPARHGISAVAHPARPASIYGPGRPAPVMTLAAARRRRRDVLYGLTGGVLLALVLAVTLGGPFVVLFPVAVVALFGYVAALVRAQHLAQERKAKVRYLRQSGLGPVPAADDEPAADLSPAYLLSSSAR
jgi:Flp pilus assembly protein TadB